MPSHLLQPSGLLTEMEMSADPLPPKNKAKCPANKASDLRCSVGIALGTRFISKQLYRDLGMVDSSGYDAEAKEPLQVVVDASHWNIARAVLSAWLIH